MATAAYLNTADVRFFFFFMSSLFRGHIKAYFQAIVEGGSLGSERITA